MRVFSFGGGVQSTAALVLAALGKIDYRVFLFANVGDDSENPDTLAYVRDVSVPFAARHGLELHELRRKTNNGETLYQRLLREKRSVGIPMRFPNGRPGRRPCTINFKMKVIHGWMGKGEHVTGIGFSLDEFHRMRTDSGFKNVVNEYPLIDLRLDRAGCLEIVRKAGLPQPPKSSCWFCPFHSLAAWQDLRRNHPDLFDKSVQLEKHISDTSVSIGRARLWMTRKAKPLDQVVPDQLLLITDDDDNCESGYCMV